MLILLMTVKDVFPINIRMCTVIAFHIIIRFFICSLLDMGSFSDHLNSCLLLHQAES